MLLGCASRVVLPYLLFASPWEYGGLGSQYAIAELGLDAYIVLEAF
jgi:hypothetical protein